MRSSFSIFILFLLLTIVNCTYGQSDTTAVNNKRLKWFIGSSSVVYAGSLIALNELWYKDFPRESFHFFNDSQEWKQVDKAGHLYSSYHISRTGYEALIWSGVSQNKSYLYAGAVGILFMTPIEIMDGYSSEYGASVSDIVANITGAGLFTLQGLAWGEVRIHPKYSFNRSDLASLRPNILGKTLNEEILKDYNAQTYWFSVDIHAFQKKFPKWLNIAVGYGAQNIIHANDVNNEENGFDSYRQYYLALDLDLSHIQSKSWIVNTLLFVGDMIHLPAPTLEYNRQNKLKFHWLTY